MVYRWKRSRAHDHELVLHRHSTIEDITTDVLTKDTPVETSTADMETVEDNAPTDLEDERCYYNLSGIRSLPVPPVYIALENNESLVENDSDEKEEMADYANDPPISVKYNFLCQNE